VLTKFHRNRSKIATATVFERKAPDFREKFFGQNVRIVLYRKKGSHPKRPKGHSVIEPE
jgi:hypothetical protein